jgi:uncharacterized membrane protein
MPEIPSPDDPEPAKPESVGLPGRRRPQPLITHEYHEIKYEAPLPPPAMMEHYERILPGSADRIIAMAEKQSQHRQFVERQVVEANLTSERLGQIFAFVLGLLGLVGGLALAYTGRLTAGLIIFLSILSSFVSIFIVGRRAQAKEREGKVDKLKAILESGTHLNPREKPPPDSTPK